MRGSALDGRTVSRRIRLASAGCALLVVAMGLAVLVGWLLGNEPLMSLLPGSTRMKPNTALGFILAGIALGALLHPSPKLRRWAPLFSSLTLGCGALTLAEYLFGFDLHLDQSLFRDPAQHLYPGRMAHMTAACFCLAGFSLLLQTGGRVSRLVAQWSALLVTGAAFVAIVGYLYGVPILYGATGYTSMPLHTGIGFLILGIGLLLIDPHAEMIRVLIAPENGGCMVRRALPGILLLPVLVGFVYLHHWIHFGNPRFSMALFAVTVAFAGSAAMLSLGRSLNREEKQRVELERIREESAAAVQQRERELRLITDHLPTLLSYISTDWRFLRVNRTYERWLGIPAESIVGRTISDLLGPKYWEQTVAAHETVMQGKTVTIEVRYPTRLGDRSAQVTYAPDIDETGCVRGIACMVLDVEERRQAESARRQSELLEQANLKLQELAVTDPLTGLKNRRALEERLWSDFALSRRHDRALSVLMIDIDNFKLRNDNWGHAAGDEVLRQLSLILTASLRIPDLAVRYGGEEFAILLPECSLEEAIVVAERIRRMVAEHDWPNDPLTLSIGVSTRTSRMTAPAQLVEAADAALYQAKRAGKDRVCFAGESL